MEIRPGYKQTEVGVIPADWVIHSVQDLIDNGSIVGHLDGNHGALYPRSEEFKHFGVPYITANDLGNHKVSFQNCKFLSESRAKRFRKGIAIDGDVLFAHNATVGPVALLETKLEYVILGTTATYFRCNTEKLSNTFVLYLLQSSLFVRQYSAVMSQSTRNQVPITAQRKLTVTLPRTKAEQEAIAEALSDADALIESLSKLIAKKRDIKQGAMQELLTGKKRLPGFSGEWEVKKLGDIAQIIMGQSPSSIHYNNKGDGLPLIQGNADVSNRKTIKRIFTTVITKNGRCGDILMSVRAPVGEISCALFDVCLGRGVCAIRYPNDFLYYALIYRETSWLKISKGSTFDSVNSSDIKGFEIELPTEENEQITIATILSDMDAEITTLEEKLSKARQIKQGMMQELLTGKVRLI